MHEELENFERNQVLELVKPPPNCKPIGEKWVWKNKQGANGEVVRYKLRLVAQCFSQKVARYKLRLVAGNQDSSSLFCG
jgi:hypothetical protein